MKEELEIFQRQSLVAAEGEVFSGSESGSGNGDRGIFYTVSPLPLTGSRKNFNADSVLTEGKSVFEWKVEQ